MLLWNFVRTCFLWMPFPLYLLCSLVFVAFAAIFALKLLKFILELIPFMK